MSHLIDSEEFQATLEHVYAHASECSPRECCGVLSLFKGKLRYLRAENIAEDPGVEFEIAQSAIIEAEDLGHAIMAYVHSHVGRGPGPTEADLVGCERSNKPWLIVSTPARRWHWHTPTGYQAPMLGRTFVHGVLDCYALIRDHYLREYNIFLPDFERQHEWWLRGQDLYRDHFDDAGFEDVTHMPRAAGDVVLIRFESEVHNHGGVLLGDGSFLHHAIGRLSSRDVFGGYWRRADNIYLRHRELM